jgi:hypothetical protein
MLCTDLQLIQNSDQIVNNFSKNHELLGYCQLFMYIMKVLIGMFGIGLCVNLYKQAMAFEKGHHVTDPDK